MKFKAILQKEDFDYRQGLAIRTENGYVATMVIKDTVRGELIEPFMISDADEDNDVMNFMQAIMDAGWKAGLKPLGYEDASRELTATKFHLEDMRLLAKVKK